MFASSTATSRGPCRCHAGLEAGDALGFDQPSLPADRVCCSWEDRDVEIVLRTETPDGVEVVLFAIVYAKILEEHAAVADLALIDRPAA